MLSRSSKARTLALVVTAVALVSRPSLRRAGEGSRDASSGSRATSPPARRPSTTRSASSRSARRRPATSWSSTRAPRPAPPTSRRSPRTSSCKAKDWQVWAVERRENLLEDHSRVQPGEGGQGHRAGAVRLLPRLAQRLEHHRPLPVHLRGRELRAPVGHEHRDRGPATRREERQEARRQGRGRRPLARRLDHDRLRDLGLQRAGPAPRGSRASCSSTAAAARRRSRRTRPTSACRASRPAPRG